MNAPAIRSSHQSSSRMSCTHDHEMFQSSWRSWSSKIIAVEIVDMSQRITGSPHDSQYSRVYSSKSATCSPGALRVSRRERMNSHVRGETSSA
jgi:hypothetical protein